jgi:UDP-N-acetylmuramoyl-L-alanyl-D-glutamate--2,6-diaminopimelate ligase
LLGSKAAYMGTLGQGEVNTLQTLDNTTPDALCIQKLLQDYKKNKIEQLCMEVSSHALCLHRVDMLKFTQAIFTNLTHDHLDFHKTMNEYAKAKAQLFADPNLKYAIINNDDDYAPIMKQALTSSVQQLTYGLKNDAVVKAVDWTIDLTGTVLTVESPWGRHQVTLNTLGKFNIYNGLAVFTSLLATGYPVENVLALMPKLKSAPGRMEIVATNPTVIVDYAHTPDALENSLATLNDLKVERLWVIFGCGGDRDKTKRPIMAKAAESYADVIIVTSDNPRSEKPESIMEDIIEGLNPNTRVLKIVNREEAILHALEHANVDDIIPTSK